MTWDYGKQPGLREWEKRIPRKEEASLMSIVTPYYNAGQYFEQTYRSVMNQTFPWFEWIIVDDGSTSEQDLDTLREIAAKDWRIRTYRKENGGISTARNLGIMQSTTEIIVPLDADDVIEPTYLELLYWGLYKHPECAWCYTDSVGFGTQEYLWVKPFDASLLKNFNFLLATSGIRKKDLLEVGCYDEITRHYNEDWRLWLKFLSNSKKPVKQSGFGFWYRRGDTGVLSKVAQDPKVSALAQKLIAEVAATADETVLAVEYPQAGDGNRFAAPKASDWSRKLEKGTGKINILMLLPWLEMGGADLFNLSVAEKLDKSRFELGIITTVYAENTWKQLFGDYVRDIFELPNFLDVTDWAEFIGYYLKSRQTDVLFLSNSYYGYYLIPWLRKEFPELAIVDYVHMEEWYWRAGGYGRTSGVMGDVLERTWVCNERTRKVMVESFGRSSESVETLYIGVDQEKYRAERAKRGLVRKEMGIEAERPVVLFPCRIHPQKRPFLMLEIAKGLERERSDITVLVVGDGPQLEEVRQAAAEMGLEETVYFAGRQEEMLGYYRDSDVTLICSLKEGLALTAYESLSMGVPVVTADVGGQAELVNDQVGAVVPLLQSEEHDLDARVFPEEEVRQYVDAVLNILGDRDYYARMSRACRARIEEGFSTDVMIEQLQLGLVGLTGNSEYVAERKALAGKLAEFPGIVGDYLTVYTEVQIRDNAGAYQYSPSLKNELMRIANSRLGRFLIKVAIKLRLNRLFK